MQILFFLICFLPFILAALVIFIVKDTIENKKISSEVRKYIIPIFAVITIVLIGYYFPNNDILKNLPADDMRISKEGVTIEIKDKDQTKQIYDAINKHTCYKSASGSLYTAPFPSENLIRIDIIANQSKRIKVIHLYVLSTFSDIDTENLEILSKRNMLQINDQVYIIEDPKGLSQDIYGIYKELTL